MTVAAKPPSISYVENGVSTVFAVPYRFKAATDLVVQRITAGAAETLAIGTDYSVTGGETDAGGTLVRTAATNGATLRIMRRTARSQPMEYTTGDRFPAESHEGALDRGILIDQEQDVALGDLGLRALQVPIGEVAPLLPPAADRAGRALVGAPDGSIATAPLGDGNDPTLRPDLAAADGSTRLGFRQAGAGAVARDAQAKMRERVSVLDFYEPTDPDLTATFLRARDYCEATGKALVIPANPFSYPVSDTISVSGSFDILGEGTEKTVLIMTSSVAKPVIEIAPPDNTIVLGMVLRGLQIRCSGGPAACDGVSIHTSAENSTIRQCEFGNLWIRDTRRGLSIAGVVYRNFFRNITVQGVAEHGLYSDVGLIDVTYNTFEQIEVTNVGDGAWAYYLRSNYSTFDTLTADGVSYFSSPGGALRGFRMETVQASTFPESAGDACLKLNQMQLLEAPCFIGIDPDKRSYAMWLIGQDMTVVSPRFTAPQPESMFYLESGSRGTIISPYADSLARRVEQDHTNALLNNWLFLQSDAIAGSHTMRNQMDAWTPSFSAEWTTPPTDFAGTYRRVGGMVVYIVTGKGGTCTAGARIGGAPVLHSTAGTGRLVSPTQESACSILPGSGDPTSSDFINFRAMTIPAGDYWQLTVEAGA
ncbi:MULTISPECIES: hypothetical protein [unclassified Sphingomonas]|uniref:hypothetical protein n=1 Tax=unclassified Sphingomonas TaxID=196159 RepID=UPI00092A4535|nr:MULTISPECIES: hypothetical protein [unclassified Sphingomonas]MBN8848148.1 hypothetical protein [Sphingomonas sp.]OJV30643.1 MAG: hypothetical protein BGO24_07980 [Sphingomonas sp. 67-36]